MLNFDEYFKDHVATLTVLKDESGNVVERLNWSKPGTGINRIVYFRYGCVLVVFGDLGAAIYQWSDLANLEWISCCNIGYFAGKCQASEEGRVYKIWDSDVLEERIAEYFESRQDENPIGFAKFKASSGPHSTSFRDEWMCFLEREGHEHFGQDFYEWAYGETVAPRCHLHLEGLRRAFKQLKPEEDHAD